MARISRPILYLLVAGVGVYAVVLLTEPDAPAKKKAKATTKSAAKSADGIMEEDYTAHFARYTARNRDAFAPKVVPKKTSGTEATKTPPNNGGLVLEGKEGSWMLTGISAIDGIQSALIENNATRESVFVRAGEVWNGLRVTSITADAVVFVNAQGKEMRLAFAQTAPGGSAQNGTGLNGTSAATPGAPAANTAPNQRGTRQN